MPAGVVLLGRLGPVFRWFEARSPGLSDSTLHQLLTEGCLKRISHGLYLQADSQVPRW